MIQTPLTFPTGLPGWQLAQALSNADRALAYEGRVIGVDSPVSFANTGVPILLIAAAALAVPLMLVPRATRSHRRLLIGLAVCALVMIVLSAAILALVDARDLGGALAVLGPVRLAMIYVQSGLPFALVWVPLLGLIWIGRALRIERLRGEDKMREDL